MKVYLAARFSRANELLGYRSELMEHGIEVTSRWLLGEHEWSGTDDDALTVDESRQCATIDIADIDAANVVVCFTEAPRSGPSRGGRHVEFGYALARGKPIVVVGHRENVFYCLDGAVFVSSWPEAKHFLLTADSLVAEAIHP